MWLLFCGCFPVVNLVGVAVGLWVYVQAVLRFGIGCVAVWV